MSKNTSARGKLTEFMSLEEQRLNLRMQAIRAAIDHAGEKGRGIEGAVMDFIRGLLPEEYGLDTGFIAHRQGENGDLIALSTQLDIIIYDRVRGAALADLGTARVFPLEAVYGYVEVKTMLDAKELTNSVKANNEIRAATDRRFYHTELGSPIDSRVVTYSELVNRYHGHEFKPMLPPRAFIVCLESQPKDLDELASNLTEVTKGGAYFHGVFVAGAGFVTADSLTEEPAVDFGHRNFTAWKQFGAVRLRTMLQLALASFPRVPAGISYATHDYFSRIIEMSCTSTVNVSSTVTADVLQDR